MSIELANMYDVILSHATEAIFIFDSSGTIIYANGEAVRETGFDSLREVDITRIFPMALHHSRDGIVWDGTALQTFAYRQNKTCYPVKLTCVTLDEETVAAYAINDSERYNAVRSHKQAMEQVEEADKMKNEFTANITHELRTPINGIKGMAEGLENTELTPQQEETVGIILHCCENMTKIINDILDFSKIEAGKIEIVPEEFSLKKFLNDTLSFHVGRINEKGLKLVVNIGSDVPDFVVGDELRLGQVMNNLISNAIKFTSQGRIALELTANKTENDDETELFFMIIDTGIGIADDERDKLFKSFSQVDGSITRRFGGTGLGLAITKQLVTLMGGSISVDSEKGKGSTFSFTVRVKALKKHDTSISFPEGSFVFTGNLPTAAPGPDPGSVAVYADKSPMRFDASVDSDYSEEEQTEPVPVNEIPENLEKLMICIELGSWEKAENFATLVKTQIAECRPELKNRAFSLLLNVRKEKYEQSMDILKELEETYGI